MYSVARSPPRTPTPRPSKRSLDRNFTCARIRSPEISVDCASATMVITNRTFFMLLYVVMRGSGRAIPNTGHWPYELCWTDGTYGGMQIACLTLMAKLERVRDFVVDPPSKEYFGEKLADGWRLVAIEWERGAAPPGRPIEDIPFGLRVA